MQHIRFLVFKKIINFVVFTQGVCSTNNAYDLSNFKKILKTKILKEFRRKRNTVDAICNNKAQQLHLPTLLNLNTKIVQEKKKR